MGHSVWRDLGGYPGLRAEALIRLANRATPAPWTGVAGTFGLTMRRGRLRAWQYARAWIEDIQASHSAPAYIEDSVLPKYAVRRSGLLSEGIGEAPESRLDLDAGLQEVRTKILREEVVKMLARDGFDPANMLGNGLELEAGLTEVRANLARSRGTP
jgi:hypothetical protein